MRIRFCDADPGPNPPSSSGFDQSLMTFAGSKSYLLPRPLHSGHAPYMLLKENERGSSMRNVDAALRTRQLRGIQSLVAVRPPRPAPVRSAIFIASSTEAARRPSIPGFTSRRSTTTSMVWFLRLSSLISSSAMLRNSPSMRARRKSLLR